MGVKLPIYLLGSLTAVMSRLESEGHYMGISKQELQALANRLKVRDFSSKPPTTFISPHKAPPPPTLYPKPKMSLYFTYSAIDALPRFTYTDRPELISGPTIKFPESKDPIGDLQTILFWNVKLPLIFLAPTLLANFEIFDKSLSVLRVIDNRAGDRPYSAITGPEYLDAANELIIQNVFDKTIGNFVGAGLNKLYGSRLGSKTIYLCETLFGVKTCSNALEEVGSHVFSENLWDWATVGNYFNAENDKYGAYPYSHLFEKYDIITKKEVCQALVKRQDISSIVTDAARNMITTLGNQQIDQVKENTETLSMPRFIPFDPLAFDANNNSHICSLNTLKIFDPAQFESQRLGVSGFFGTDK